MQVLAFTPTRRGIERWSPDIASAMPASGAFVIIVERLLAAAMTDPIIQLFARAKDITHVSLVSLDPARAVT